MSSEEYAALQAEMEAMGSLIENPFFQGGIMFLTVLLIGLIVTILSAWILQHKPKAASLDD